MFFGYPIAATAGNWLHDCLCEMVTAIHAGIDAGQQPAAWPGIIPVAYRQRLRLRTGLRVRLTAYAVALQGMAPARRTQILTCLTQQNAITDLISGVSNCENLTDLPVAIREPLKALFVFAFELLTDLDIRDEHYTIIYNTIRSKVCPFCGLECFDAPGAPREDLDHYLAVSRYPFAAANLRNLTPMGMKCNERHKHDSDILRDEAGNRRMSFDPYVRREIQVSLINSIPFGQADGQTPQWHLEFIPNSPECVTWDNVFHIRKRIERDVLNPLFRDWIGFFASWFVKRKGVMDLSNERIVTALQEYSEDAEITGLTAREFLRVPVFQMIRQHCSDGNTRLLQLMRGLITDAVPQPPATS